MKFSIGNQSLRHFVRAIHSLGKIGEEIYFEWIPEGLSMRSVNSSRSAYACFTFYFGFFSKCTDVKSEPDAPPFRWKISVKSCLTVFRSQASIEKKVERCKISLDTDEARLSIQFFCKQGIIKTYRLTIIDCESLQAVFQLKDSMSTVTVSSKMLSEIMHHFQPGQEEVTLCAKEEGVELRNYVEDESERRKTINTTLMLSSEEFDEYHIVKDVAVTFCIKELKALLSYGEPINLPLKIYFEGAGRPMIFTYEGEGEIVSHFVLATLADCPGPSQMTGTQTSNTSRRYNSTQPTRRSSQPSTIVERSESFGDIDIETFMDGENEEEVENAMMDLQNAVESRLQGTKNNSEHSPVWESNNENHEPLSKKRCTGLFASILEESELSTEPTLSTPYASQRLAGNEKVLVADSDPED